MSDIAYSQIVDEVWSDTQGAQTQQIERAIRDSVKDLCDCLDVLRKDSYFDYESKDAVYTIRHPEWDFGNLIAVYLDKALVEYQADYNTVTDLTIGAEETTFQMPYLTKAKKVIVRWSYRPKITSDRFPYLLWSQFRDAIRYGALKRLKTFLRPMGRKFPDYDKMWEEEIFAAKRRINPLPGPEQARPFVGGEDDYYGAGGDF